MSRHHTLIIKETHRGLFYEDGILREVLPAGRHRMPSEPSMLSRLFGARDTRFEVVLIDVRSRDRTVLVRDLLTADCATISASFLVHYRVVDPRAAVLEARNFEERLYVDAQTAARRTLRGLSLGEVMSGRDEIGEEIHLHVRAAAEAYGLEITTLDFKDLELPEELRQSLNRAAIARRLDPFSPAEAGHGGTEVDSSFANAEPEEAEVILARMAFDRDDGPGEEGASHRPAGLDPRVEGLPSAGFEGLRRFRP